MVKLVRNQAEMLVTAENLLKQKKEKRAGQEQPDVIVKRLQAEIKKVWKHQDVYEKIFSIL